LFKRLNKKNRKQNKEEAGMKKSVYIIPQKETPGSIHDISSQHFDRRIIFGHGCKYAVVLASYYGGKGYTTHRTEYAAVCASKKNEEYSHAIIDRDGKFYRIESAYYRHDDALVPTGDKIDLLLVDDEQ
jgi:hypothetical protein